MLSKILWRIGMVFAGAAIALKILGGVILFIIGIILLCVLF